MNVEYKVLIYLKQKFKKKLDLYFRLLYIYMINKKYTINEQ